MLETDTQIPPQPQPFGYVVFDDSGALVESCFQLPPAAHVGRVIAVDEDTRANWTAYRANAARDGVESIPPTPAPTASPAQVVAGYMAVVQKKLDTEAVRFGYDDIVSVISYAEEPAVPRYQVEGQAFRAWRSLAWAHCEQVFADVVSGTREAPTYAELLDELPTVGIEPSGALTATA